MGYYGRYFMQLLPAIFQSILIFSRLQPKGVIQAKLSASQARAIIGLGFLIFFLPKEIGKNQKTQPGTTEGSGT